MLFLFVFSIVLVHLSDAYLRFLAFRDQMTEKDTHRLWKMLIAWGLANMVGYIVLFQETGIVTSVYKFVLLLGWIPYLAIFMHVVPHQTYQHIFIFSMSALWSFISHNWSNIAVATFLMDADESLVLRVHAALYLVWFGLFLPISRRCFSNMLPSRGFFDQRPLGIYIAWLPIVMLSGHLIMIADARLWHSWEERVSRLCLPIVFFFIYRYALIAAKRFFEKQRLARNAQLLENQVAAMEEYRQIMESNREKVHQLRKHLLQSYQDLHAMLEKGELTKAMEYIEGQERLLDATVLHPFSDSPIINAALSVYLHRAKALHIQVQQQVSIPTHPATDETDLAMVLSNLLENALQATAREKQEERKISFVLRQTNEQFVLEIANRCHAPLSLNTDGMPRTSRQGHGIGMVSLKAFLKKYGGYAAFSQEDGWVKLFLYWEDKNPCGLSSSLPSC